MDFERALNMIATKTGSILNPEFSCRMEAISKSDFLADDKLPAGTIMCIQDASKISSLSFYSGWEIRVARGQGNVASPMQTLYVNGVLVLSGIHRNKVAEVRGLVYRALLGRLRAAHTGQRGV